MNYLFLGYTATWALIAGYILILGRRQKALQKEIKQLEEWNSEE